MLYKYSNLFVLFSSSVYAIALNNDPAVTKCMAKGEGEAPEPTQPPNAHDLRIRDIPQKTLLAASDNTCGFFGGSTDKPWGCSASSTCVFETALPTTASSTSSSIYTSLSLSVAVSSSISTSLSIDTVANSTSTQTQTQTFSTTITHTQVLTETQFAPSTTTIAPTTAGSVLCCDAASGCPTAAPTACVDRGKYDYNSSCTGSCPDDPMTLKCTSGIYLYCATLAFPTPSISALYCNYLSTYPASPAVAATGSNFTATTVSHFIINATPTPSNSSSKTGKASSSATAASGGGKEGSTSKGPIIGGVVGGLAAVALVAGAVIFFLRRRAKGVEPVAGKESPVGSLKQGASVVVQAK